MIKSLQIVFLGYMPLLNLVRIIKEDPFQDQYVL